MTVPQRKLEVEFTAGVWTDLSKYLLVGHSFTRGRTAESGQASVGTAQFTLRNDAGRFDPLNATSPLAPNLLPLKRVRYSVVLADGTVYRRFTGRVAGWPQRWEKHGKYGTVTLTCFDGLRDLAAYTFGKSYATSVLTENPSIYFPLSTRGKINAAFPAGNGVQPGQGGQLSTLNRPNVSLAPAVIAGSDVPSLRRSAPTGTNSVAFFSAEDPPYQLGGDFTISILARLNTIPSDSTAVYPLAVHDGGSPSGNLQTYMRAQFGASPAAARWQFGVGTAAPSTSTPVPVSAAVPVAGQTDLLVLRRSGSTVTALVNGAVIGSVTFTGTVELDNDTGLAATTFLGGVQNAVAPLTLDISQFAVWERALSDATLTEHYLAATVAREFPQQTVNARVRQVLDQAAWPALDRQIANSTRLVAPSGDLGGKTALAVVQDAVSVDLGLAYVDHFNQMVTVDRPAPGAVPVDAIIGDGYGELPYTDDLTVDFDEQRIANDITVTGPGEPALQARVTDPASIAAYGPSPRTLTHTAPYALQTDVDVAAAYLLARSKDPHARIDTVTFDIAANPALQPLLAAGVLGATIRVRRRPPGAPPIEVLCVIEQITERGGRDSLTVSFQLSPAP